MCEGDGKDVRMGTGFGVRGDGTVYLSIYWRLRCLEASQWLDYSILTRPSLPASSPVITITITPTFTPH